MSADHVEVLAARSDARTFLAMLVPAEVVRLTRIASSLGVPPMGEGVTA